MSTVAGLPAETLGLDVLRPRVNGATTLSGTAVEVPLPTRDVFPR